MWVGSRGARERGGGGNCVQYSRVRKLKVRKDQAARGRPNHCCGEGKDVSSALHNVFSLINSSSSSSILTIQFLYLMTRL